ncbi:MAG: hypothetical protein C4520_11635 [Candidatus Abyssobacteria bacterium SURF_5]|uniref:Uncharacterized protein n=1 Tax=Abyssobacteria bacterium (strain SURF_5) TaxID=2093360 RepID=A0A3A4NPB1_ABYX5|nr:MAG: hypothetical protein C4520_11635 [Candidatus Abyssubacteria bacterium SURF_5]
MFIVLLLVTFLTAALVSFIVVRAFSDPISRILERIISDQIAEVWAKYLRFAIYVVGISGGVRIYELQRYITPEREAEAPIPLTAERWVLELYRTVIESLQSIAWMLLVFFVFALIAYVIVKIFEAKRSAGQ